MLNQLTSSLHLEVSCMVRLSLRLENAKDDSRIYVSNSQSADDIHHAQIDIMSSIHQYIRIDIEKHEQMHIIGSLLG
ncbi:hypothetical protein B0O99DRAFT_311133 [Bisporella sp. PMI_857]|nr:hypothetical protein B0O99DRAFT_311133 [Bisporella sp. PMI_857]